MNDLAFADTAKALAGCRCGWNARRRILTTLPVCYGTIYMGAKWFVHHNATGHIDEKLRLLQKRQGQYCDPVICGLAATLPNVTGYAIIIYRITGAPTETTYSSHGNGRAGVVHYSITGQCWKSGCTEVVILAIWFTPKQLDENYVVIVRGTGASVRRSLDIESQARWGSISPDPLSLCSLMLSLCDLPSTEPWTRDLAGIALLIRSGA